MKKNVLIVSNNQLSTTDSNGKTLLSLFNPSKFNIMQFYVIPSSTPYEKVVASLCINDLDVFKKKDTKKVVLESNSRIKKKSPSKHLLRELLWKTSRYQYFKIEEWLENLNFDAIFFLMGDSLFMCDIAKFIIAKTNLPLLTYVTDVYTNNLKLINPVDYLIKKLIFKKQVQIINLSSSFYTISEMMSRYYKEIFNVKNELLRNITKVRIENRDKNNAFIYAGNLYYGRDIELIKFSQALKAYNEKYDTCYEIFVYSGGITEALQKELQTNGYLAYKGKVSFSELEDILNESKYALFVESYKKENLEKIKYSFSTKITELAKLGKCILAMGPSSASSIIELSNFSYMIYENKNVLEELEIFFTLDYKLFEDNALKYAEINYNEEKQASDLEKKINKLSE
ncbi:hypothetical protein ACWG0P_01745 [Amedibacillus sp. YH-ame6]